MPNYCAQRHLSLAGARGTELINLNNLRCRCYSCPEGFDSCDQGLCSRPLKNALEPKVVPTANPTKAAADKDTLTGALLCHMVAMVPLCTTLYPTPYTPYPTPCTLYYPIPYTLYPVPRSFARSLACSLARSLPPFRAIIEMSVIGEGVAVRIGLEYQGIHRSD